MVDGLWLVVFRTQMPSAYAELGETCAATTPALGIAIPCARATPQLRFAQLRTPYGRPQLEGSQPRTNNQQLTTNNY